MMHALRAVSVTVMCHACVMAAANAPSHDLWDGILHQYVSTEARVDYAALRTSGKPKLDQYIAIVAEKWPDQLPPSGRKAALINAYNSLMVSWILQNYPVESVWRTKHPFTAARHMVDGRKMSLDDIETTLRNMGDPRIHAALVCVSRSCPPLRREAYTETRLDEQLDDNARRWLANPELNEFHAGSNSAEVSKIFDWYHGDFEKNGGSVRAFLAKYSPRSPSFPVQNTALSYKQYRWGLNDVSKLGEGYSQLNFLLDAARNK